MKNVILLFKVTDSSNIIKYLLRHIVLYFENCYYKGLKIICESNFQPLLFFRTIGDT